MTIIRGCLAILLIGAGLAACSKSDAPTAAVAPIGSAQAGEAKVAPKSAGTTGIAVCDQFLDAYESCVTTKMPESVRGQMQTGLDQWRQSWRDLAANAATKESLPQICQQARESSSAAMQAYGCTF